MKTSEDLRQSRNFDSSLHDNKDKDAVASFLYSVNPAQQGLEDIFSSNALTNSQDEVEFSFDILGESKESAFSHSQISLGTKTFEQSEEILQKWEGVVDAVDEDSKIFTAQLYDPATDEPYPNKVAELLIDDVSDDDQDLLQVGSIFYLTVGYSTRGSGQKDRFVRLKFRRLPNWTESDLRRVRERAQRITRFLNSES